MRSYSCILSLLLLCGVTSGSVALEASALPSGIRPSIGITKVAHRNKVTKHRKPSRPKHRKNYRPPVSRHRQ